MKKFFENWKVTDRNQQQQQQLQPPPTTTAATTKFNRIIKDDEGEKFFSNIILPCLSLLVSTFGYDESSLR